MANVAYPFVLSMPRTHIELVMYYRAKSRCFEGKVVIEDTGIDTLRIECENETDRAFLIMLREADPNSAWPIF
jgi:hypothetical protein